MGNLKKLFGAPEENFIVEEATVMDQEEVVRQAIQPRISHSTPVTVIAKGQVLEGTLRGEGTIQVEGGIVGQISLKGAVLVANGGTVKGPVEADVIHVAGHIEGNVMAHNHLCLERTGRVDGDISTASLVVEDGGKFNGRCTTLEKPASATPRVEKESRLVEKLQFGPNYAPKAAEDVVSA